MKLSIISLAIAITLAFLGGHAIAAEPAGAPPKWDADQNALWILVYKVDETAPNGGPKKRQIRWSPVSEIALIPAGGKHLGKGLPAPTKWKSHAAGKRTALAAEKQAKSEESARSFAQDRRLEFRIVATKRDDQSLIELAKAERKKSPSTSKVPSR